MNLDNFRGNRPALAVLATNIVEDFATALADSDCPTSVDAHVMNENEMAAALELPWNLDRLDVAEQVRVTVTRDLDQMANLLLRIESSFRVVEMAERPAPALAKRRFALRCLIPAHLASRDWSDPARPRPQTFVAEIFGA